MTYTIKQFADMFDTTEHTIRYYTDIQLLPCQRDSQNRRIFDENAVHWMQTISCLKQCGTPLKDIQEYCRLCQLEETEENLYARYQIILRQRSAAYKKAAEAQATVAFIDKKVKHYEEIFSHRLPDKLPQKQPAGREDESTS